MRVLLTNITLASRTGTEVNIRDFAVGLLRRGHQPVVYSPDLGVMAAEIRAATVPVVNDLAGVAIAPDVIHGHHHTVTLEALLRFPGVPAVFFVHDWQEWHDEPLRFPRVALYAPVDATNADRVALEHGIDPRRVRVLLNAVDVDRFRPRGPLPARPRRALVFSNYATEGNYLPAVREACERTGIELTVAGALAGAPAARPEELLGEFDLVFAKARCALEAMSVGAAVVLCDAAGLGSMVTAAGFDRLRPLNFGRRALDRAVTVEGLVDDIARYDAADAARVSQRVRAEANLELALDRLLETYGEAVAFGRDHRADPAAEARACADYLRRWAPQFDRLREDQRIARRLEARLPDLEARLADFGARIPDLEARLADLRARLAGADVERASLAGALEVSARERDGLRATAATAAAAAERERVRLQLALDDAGRELAWIQRSATWRWRERLLRVGGVRAVYRWMVAGGRQP